MTEKRVGRPPGKKMPCGWGCGAELTASEIRGHFTSCPLRGGGEIAKIGSKEAGELDKAAELDIAAGRFGTGLGELRERVKRAGRKKSEGLSNSEKAKWMREHK
jgi:hypothetical protein